MTRFTHGVGVCCPMFCGTGICGPVRLACMCNERVWVKSLPRVRGIVPIFSGGILVRSMRHCQAPLTKRHRSMKHTGYDYTFVRWGRLEGALGCDAALVIMNSFPRYLITLSIVPRLRLTIEIMHRAHLSNWALLILTYPSLVIIIRKSDA